MAAPDRPLDAPAPDRGERPPQRAAVVLVLVLLTVATVAALTLTAWPGARAQVEVREGQGQWVPSHAAANLGDEEGALGFYRDGRWIDSDGDWHLGGRPDCLPADGRMVDVAFGVVEVEADDGYGWWQPVFVSCQQ